MRLFYFPLLFGLALILQSALIPIVLPDWLNAGIDLPLIVVIHIALTRGKISGMISGLFLGYLQDAISGGVLGINGIAKIVAGFAGGLLREKFFMRSMAHRAASVAGAVLVSYLVKIAVLALFSQPGPSVLSFPFIWGIAGNTVAALVVHVLLDRFEVAFGIRAEEELSLGD